MKRFDYGSRKICNPTKTLMMHTDGNFYICHGCIYLSTKKDFQLGDTRSISDLGEMFNKIDKIVALDVENDKCKHCSAVWCTSCHVNYVDSKNIHDDWIQCVSNAKMRC